MSVNHGTTKPRIGALRSALGFTNGNTNISKHTRKILIDVLVKDELNSNKLVDEEVNYNAYCILKYLWLKKCFDKNGMLVNNPDGTKLNARLILKSVKQIAYGVYKGKSYTQFINIVNDLVGEYYSEEGGEEIDIESPTHEYIRSYHQNQTVQKVVTEQKILSLQQHQILCNEELKKQKLQMDQIIKQYTEMFMSKISELENQNNMYKLKTEQLTKQLVQQNAIIAIPVSLECLSEELLKNALLK
jgi:hypothetical protein